MTLPRWYSVPISNVTIGTAVQDIFEVTAPATGAIILGGLYLTQTTDLGEGEEAQYDLVVRHGTSGTTSGSGGASVTPTPLVPGDAAATFSAERNNTTQMSGGTITDKLHLPWAVRASLPEIWPEEFRVVAQASQRLTVALSAVTARALTAYGHLLVGELF